MTEPLHYRAGGRPLSLPLSVSSDLSKSKMKNGSQTSASPDGCGLRTPRNKTSVNGMFNENILQFAPQYRNFSSSTLCYQLCERYKNKTYVTTMK